jgi:diacylglycerol kinase family enzyme
MGIVSSPRAGRHRRDPGAPARLARLLGDLGVVRSAGTPEALEAALEAFQAAGVDTVGVHGGDGTAHLVLTALVRRAGAGPLPRLLPLRGGTMNVLAGNLGLRGTPEEILAAVLEAARRGAAPRLERLDLLRVEADGGPPGHGFLVATGAAVRFLERFYEAPAPTLTGAWRLAARAAGSLLLGGALARELTARERLRVEAGGVAWEGDHLALVAGTVPSLGLGLEVLGRAREAAGHLQVVGVHGPLHRVLLALPRAARGGRWPAAAATEGLAREAMVEGAGFRFMLDGELLGPAHRLRLAAGPALEVLLPP